MTSTALVRGGITAAMATLSYASSYVFDMPSAAEPYFRPSAAIGGAAGYWLSLASDAESLKFRQRAIGVVIAITLVALLSEFIAWYFVQPLTGTAMNIIAKAAFGANFALICLFIGLCGINVLGAPPAKGE